MAKMRLLCHLPLAISPSGRLFQRPATRVKMASGAPGVLLVAALGALLALQGWRSRIPNFDVLTTIGASQELIDTGRLPDRGVVTSFASFTPPGATWLMTPGVWVFSEPRLFEYLGSLGLYIGTLFGIFALARRYLGRQCALLAVVLYGLSVFGLSAAGSLWQRYPIHCFVVWMVYWVAKWVDEDRSIFLALALLTWAAGMYVFLEMAPAILIIPVIWLFYRPSIRVALLVPVALLAAGIWYPYLQFEQRRGFIDVRSQVFREPSGRPISTSPGATPRSRRQAATRRPGGCLASADADETIHRRTSGADCQPVLAGEFQDRFNRS